MGGPRMWVDPPPFTPLPFGLLSVADPAPVTAREPHWRNGVEFQPDHCGPAGVAEARCLSDGLNLEPLDGLPIRGADPFAVYAWLPCGPLSYADRADAEARVSAALTNTEQTVVEAAFWTGVGQAGGGTIYPHLAADDDVVEGTAGSTEIVTIQSAAVNLTTGGPVDVAEWLGVLEGALATCYSGVGVIHVPRTVVAHLAHRGLVSVVGNQLKTTAGTLVAAGAGYPGTGPDGSLTVGAEWGYITGALRYWRSGVELNSHDWRESIDRSVNDLVLVASRAYVIGWDCCHFAAQVSIGGVHTGTFGSAA